MSSTNVPSICLKGGAMTPTEEGVTIPPARARRVSANKLLEDFLTIPVSVMTKTEMEK